MWNSQSTDLTSTSIDHPELGFKEYHAHDVLTAFMSKHGFEVTKHYHLETAWLATYSHGKGGRTIGINSEVRTTGIALILNSFPSLQMDALTVHVYNFFSPTLMLKANLHKGIGHGNLCPSTIDFYLSERFNC